MMFLSSVRADVLLSLVLRISLDLVKEKKKNIILRMNESCVKAFHRGKL